PRVPRHLVQTPAKTESGRSSPNANHVGVFFGFVSVYSQNEVHGTTQRLSGMNQRRQCGDFTFRMFVIVAPPKAGGPGIPQRTIASSRTPSGALRTTGAR